jgi:hypothetical protein
MITAIYHKCARAALILVFLPLVIFTLSPVLKAAVSKKKVTITRTVNIVNEGPVKGAVKAGDKNIRFDGIFSFKPAGNGKTIIFWHKVSGKKIKPYFKSVFKTKSAQLKKGQKLYVRGNFKRLFAALNITDPDSDQLADESLSDTEQVEQGDDTGLSAGAGTDSSEESNLSTSAAESPTNTTEETKPAPTPTTPSTPDSTTPEVSVSSSSDESCPHDITDTQIHIKVKKVTSYSDGSTDAEACRTTATYDLMNTYEDCSPRHDYVSALTYLQQKTGYVNDEGNFVMIKACHDTKTTFVHQKISAKCPQHYDKDNNLIYQAKKTYYTDTQGNIHFISECNIDSTAFTAVTADDYLKEYSNNDRIDLDAMMAFKRFKYYVQLDSLKEYVSDFEDDLTGPMPIFKDYESCSFYHDFTSEKSYKQYQLVYHKEGAKKTVSECRHDPNLTFFHITDDKFCTPEIINRKIYKKLSTYFKDETGQKVTVKDCTLTDEEKDIDPAFITKNYEKCKARLDFGQNRAVAAYIEEVGIGTTVKEISTCTEDINTFYPITQTDIGCSYRVDTGNNRAILQKRLHYNNGTENVYVSDCQDTDITTNLSQSAESCTPKVTGEQLTEYKETFYIDSAGNKKIVTSCAPSGNTLPITEDMKIYDYDSCPDYVDLAESKSYRRFKTFVDVMGTKTLLKSCTIDLTKYYAIIETQTGCNIRHDFSAGQSILQKKLGYLGNGGIETEVKPCYDTAKVFAHQKMVDTCKPAYDSELGATYDTKKLYFLDDSNNVTFISGCMIDLSTAQAVQPSDIKIEYSFADTVDYTLNQAYKRYREYILLSGETKQYVSPLQDDTANPMPIITEYDKCSFLGDPVVGISYRQFQEVYYRDGTRKVISDCQKDAAKSFAHITDAKYCVPKIQNKKVYTKVSTYFLDETSHMNVVKDCELNGSEEDLDPSLIVKNYDECSPRLDFVNMQAITAYKEQVIFDENVKTLSDCTEDPAKFHTIALSNSGCEYRVDLPGGEAILQKRMYYNTGTKNVFVSECQDTDLIYPFVKTTSTCVPAVADDGLNFQEMEETYFIDGSGVKRTVISCAANGNSSVIPESSKIRDYSKCSPEINLDEMRAYARFEVYAKAGTENVLIAGCDTDVVVSWPIEEDFSSCPVKYDLVNKVAIQQKKLYYKKGDQDVNVSACIESDMTYGIGESTDGCTYRIDMGNKKAVLQRRQYYSAGGVLNYISDCYDTAENAPITTSQEFCTQDLTDNGLFLKEAEESFYINYQAEKVIVQACSQTGNLTAIPDEYKHKNYENCNYLISMETGKAHPQYQTFVQYGTENVMTQGCMPDYEIEYTLQRDFSACGAKTDLVNDKVTELVKWFFKKGTEDIYVTDCIESANEYPILARTDTCEALPIENNPNQVIVQQQLYYVNNQNQSKNIGVCEPTPNQLAITEEICSPRYHHDWGSVQSFISTRLKVGNQVIRNCAASSDYNPMPHLQASCGWSNDDANYRSTLKVRTYIADAITGGKVYLDACHNSNTFVSYNYLGIYLSNNDHGGNPANCDGGLFWANTASNISYCSPFLGTYANFTMYLNTWDARSFNTFKSGHYKAEYRHYRRPNNTDYYIWLRNQCGFTKHVAIAGFYSCGTGPVPGMCCILVNAAEDSASDFAGQYLSWGAY